MRLLADMVTQGIIRYRLLAAVGVTGKSPARTRMRLFTDKLFAFGCGATDVPGADVAKDNVLCPFTGALHARHLNTRPDSHLTIPISDREAEPGETPRARRHDPTINSHHCTDEGRYRGLETTGPLVVNVEQRANDAGVERSHRLYNTLYTINFENTLLEPVNLRSTKSVDRPPCLEPAQG